MTTDDFLKQGIAALKAGRKAEAHNLLMQAIQQDERNEMAWLWLSGTTDTDEDRRICLENVLAINPNNEAARRGLAMLQQRQVSQPTKVESPRGEAQLETVKDGATFPVSEPTSTRSQWVMLEEDTRGKFVRTGFLSHKYYFRSGKLRTRTEIRKKDYQELLQLQEETPMVVMRGKGDRTWWMFRNEFYLDDESHTADEVKWLILHPFTRLVNLWRQREKLEQQAERLLRQDDRLVPWAKWVLDHIFGDGPLPTEEAVEDQMLELGFTTEDIQQLRATPAGAERAGFTEYFGKLFEWSHLRRKAVEAEMATIPAQMEAILAHAAQVKASTAEMEAIPAQVEAILAEIEGISTLVEEVMAHVAQVQASKAEKQATELEMWAAIAAEMGAHAAQVEAVRAHVAQVQASKADDEAREAEIEAFVIQQMGTKPDQVTAALARLVAKTREAELGPDRTLPGDRELIPDWLRRAVLARDDYICRYCGRRAQTLDVDHVVPVKQGGRSTFDNLVTACAKCNRSKGGRTPEEAEMTLLPPGTSRR